MTISRKTEKKKKTTSDSGAMWVEAVHTLEQEEMLFSPAPDYLSLMLADEVACKMIVAVLFLSGTRKRIR